MFQLKARCKQTKIQPWLHLHFIKETQETAQETRAGYERSWRQAEYKLEPFFQYLCSSLNMMNVYLCLQFHVRGTCYRFLKVQRHHPAEEVPEFKRAGNWDNSGGSNVDTCPVCTLSTVHLEMNLFLRWCCHFYLITYKQKLDQKHLQWPIGCNKAKTTELIK